MYDIRWIRENADLFDKGLVSRGLEPLSKDLLALDDRRRAAISLAQSVQEKRNVFSKEIGQAIANKDTGRAEALKLEVARLKETLTASEDQEKQLIAALDAALSTIANMPLESVPVGRDERENVVRSVWGQPRGFSFSPKQHFEIGENLGLISKQVSSSEGYWVQSQATHVRNNCPTDVVSSNSGSGFKRLPIEESVPKTVLSANAKT